MKDLNAVMRDYVTIPETPSIGGTAKSWFTKHHNKAANTVQIQYKEHNDTLDVWVPRNRVIDASHSTYTKLNGSRRDYKGLKVEHATETTLLVSSTNQIIFYSLAK